MGASGAVEAILDDGSAMAAATLEAAVARLSPELRTIIDYHFGWADAHGRPTSGRGSKSIRPALVLSTARAVGAEGPDVAAAAVAVQLMHNFAFVHDDIIDRDEYRWDRPTAWTVFGTGAALNAGDALLVLAQQLLLETSAPGRNDATRLVLDTTYEIVRGQAVDIAYESRTDLTVAGWELEARAKTAASYSCAALIVPVLFAADAGLVAGLAEFGLHLGLAVQATDDVLGIWGRSEDTGGREPGFDLRARKATLPVVFTILEGGPSADELAHLLADGEGDLAPAAVDRARALIDQGGGLEATIALASASAQRLATTIDGLDCPAPRRDELSFIVRRGMPFSVDDWPAARSRLITAD